MELKQKMSLSLSLDQYFSKNYSTTRWDIGHQQKKKKKTK